jgi:hypothetical protein
MNQQIASMTPGNNGESTPHDLFVLTDEQILEIEPETAESEAVGQPLLAVQERSAEAQTAKTSPGAAIPAHAAQNDASQSAQPGVAVPLEPPPWLAAQMKDPWTAEEAKELWNGVQQARQEAAAYRAAIATPEDARALKELYPGGVNEARSAAERARELDDIDRAYFGAAGKSPQEISASRAQLAQRMLREDPAAFREMIFAGLRALEDAGKQPGASLVGATLGSPGAASGTVSAGGASPAPAVPSVLGAPHAAPQHGDTSANEAHVAAYAAFEKAANEDLERSVGGAIERTLEQALPNTGRSVQDASSRAGQAPPLQTRLSAAIRQDVEAALKGDRQLGEQVAQILSGRRLDNETRAQVVRLIGERAQQLVPVAAKRVLNDWTQATLASHRGKSARADATSSRREVASASPLAGPTAGSNRAQSKESHRSPALSDPRRVDYRKLSDEQILEL